MTTSGNTAAAAFASVLRAEAGRRGLNQSEVAARAGIHPNTISHYWHGRRVPALETIFAIEEGLDVSPGHLVALAYAERARMAAAGQEFVGGLPVIEDHPDVLAGPAIVTTHPGEQQAAAGSRGRAGSHRTQPER